MKHAFFDRLLIILCTLLLLAIAAFGLGIVTGLVPVALVVEWLNLVFVSGGPRILFIACAAAIAVLAVFHFCIVLPKRKSRASSFALQQTEHGTLKISVRALEHLVQKCIDQHPELTAVSSSIHSDEETVRVDLRVTLQADINIPLAIASLQKQIKQYIEACSGVEVDEVRVFVEATTPVQTAVRSPYAIPDMLQPHLPKLPEQTAPASVMEPPSAQPMPVEAWLADEEVTSSAPAWEAPPTEEQAETAPNQPEAAPMEADAEETLEEPVQDEVEDATETEAPQESSDLQEGE
ncbi:MAG: alkaline shock response membrane anchor protein AmaP [Oscillospiraceae bacterium]|jgi:hypothetical protein|nr:alkaline shock response membrane anchor protein AmaP [Oscillospiraceae bacterium]